MRSSKLLLLLQLCIFSLHIKVTNADDGGDDYAADDYGGDDYADDYAAVVYEDDYMYEADYIQYFTTYALLPKRCIVYNQVDVIVYQLFKNGYKQCSDTPMGTYITNTATFVGAYLDQKELEYADTGVDDYVEPAAAGFMYCTEVEVDDNQYYAMLGCHQNSTQQLSVNLFYDNACTERANKEYSEDYDDDAQQLDLSGIQVSIPSAFNYFSTLTSFIPQHSYLSNNVTHALFGQTKMTMIILMINTTKNVKDIHLYVHKFGRKSLNAIKLVKKLDWNLPFERDGINLIKYY